MVSYIYITHVFKMEVFMDYLKMKRNLITTLMIVSLLFGILMLVTNHLDFIIAAVEYGKMNVPNIAYSLLRLISLIIIPGIFIVPSFFPYGRIRLGKVGFIAVGILYILTNAWIFYFLGNNSFSELFGNAAITDFQSKNAFVSSYIFWDRYSWISFLYTIALGAAYIYLGISLDDNRVKVRYIMLAIFAAKIILPVISNLFLGTHVLSMFWITNNYAEIVSGCAMTLAFAVASFDDNSWIDFVWDQTVNTNDDDDDEE